MSNMSLREKSIKLAVRTKEAAFAVAPTTGQAMAPVDFPVLGLFHRSLRLFDGIVALLEKDLPEEALILGRSLFSDALRLAEVEQAGDQRKALLLGWANSGIEEKKGLFHEAAKLGFEKDLPAMLNHLEEERNKLLQYAQSNGVGTLRKFLREREAAQKFGRTHDYWTFCLSHEFVHGSDAAFVFSRTKVANDTLALADRTRDHKIVAGVVCFSAASLVQAALATAGVFAWQGRADLHQLSREVNDFAYREGIYD